MFRKLVTTLGLAVVVALGSMSVAPSPSEAAVPQSWKVDRMTKIARAQVGDPYGWGAAGPSRFDCSGLVYYSIRKVTGTTGFPRTSRAQAAAVSRISAKSRRKGDLVFFGSPVYHVGIYWGNGNILHSPRPGSRVHITKIWGAYHWYGRIR